MKVMLSRDQALMLLGAAAQYGQVSEGETQRRDKWWVDRHRREAAVGAFIRVLDPYVLSEENHYRLTPKWTKNVQNEITLHDEARDGVYYLLLACLDSRSKLKLSLLDAERHLWPLAKVIKRHFALRKELGQLEGRDKLLDDDDPSLRNGPQKAEEVK